MERLICVKSENVDNVFTQYLCLNRDFFMLSTKICAVFLLKTWLSMEGLCIEPQWSLTVDLLQVTDRKEYKESTYEDILRIDQEEI